MFHSDVQKSIAIELPSLLLRISIKALIRFASANRYRSSKAIISLRTEEERYTIDFIGKFANKQAAHPVFKPRGEQEPLRAISSLSTFLWLNRIWF